MNKKKIIIIACAVIAVLGLVFVAIKLTGSNNISNGGVIKTDKGKVKIVKNEVSQITLEDYNDSNGNFKMKIPKGWKVETLGDYIHFTIKVYNPENPTYQFFFNLKSEGYNKSEAAKKWQQKFYPNDMFAKAAVIATKDTEGFYKIFNEMGPLNNTATFTFPILNDFTVIENLGKSSLGGDVLRHHLRMLQVRMLRGYSLLMFMMLVHIMYLRILCQQSK